MENEAYAELYQQEPEHWWYRGMRRITAALLNSRLKGAAHLRILDAGCGVGGNLSALAVIGNTLGVDYSPLALNYANETHTGSLARATVEGLPFAENSFDLVTCFDVLYCREVKDDVTALCELARVTRCGSYVLIRVPALDMLRGPHDTVVHGTRRYTATNLQQRVEQAGLVAIRVTYANSILMPLIFMIRLLQNISVQLGSIPRSDVQTVSRPLNWLLAEILGLEALWVASGRRFPAGVSVMCLAMKPEVSPKEKSTLAASRRF